MALVLHTGTGYGAFTYNGLDLATGTDKITVRSEPVRDDSGRTIVYHRIVITWTGILAISDPLDPDKDFQTTESDLNEMRDKLSQDGGELLFEGKGFGRKISINKPGQHQKDVNFGPKAEELSWETLGEDHAARVTWRVTCCIPECAFGTSAHRFEGVLAINYEVDHAYNERGSVIRTYNGYIQIAMTRSTGKGKGKRIPDTADQYRRFFAPRPPEGFKRTHAWKVNLSKNRVDFTITDFEIESPNPYPNKVINIEGSHRFAWSRGQGKSAKYFNTISVNIDRDVRMAGATAWLIFLQIVQQRMAAAKKGGSNWPFLMSLEITEDLFGWPCDFSLQYRTLGCLKDVLGETGLWTPIKGTNWREWRASLQNSMFASYGVSNIGHLASQDVIIDLCGSFGETQISIEPQQQSGEAIAKKVLENEKPPPETSYMAYEANMVPYRRRTVVQQQVSQAGDKDEPTSDGRSSQDQFDFGKPGGVSDIIQTGGRSRNGVIFSGTAVRAGFEIPRPRIAKIGGQTPVEKSSKHRLKLVGDHFGQPVYQLNWLIDYSVPNSPGAVSATDNLEDCF